MKRTKETLLFCSIIIDMLFRFLFVLSIHRLTCVQRPDARPPVHPPHLPYPNLHSGSWKSSASVQGEWRDVKLLPFHQVEKQTRRKTGFGINRKGFCLPCRLAADLACWSLWPNIKQKVYISFWIQTCYLESMLLSVMSHNGPNGHLEQQPPSNTCATKVAPSTSSTLNRTSAWICPFTARPIRKP